MKKVLILMATYNGGEYLQEQLNSIYAQVGVDVSILVRDDGSVDDTHEILEKNVSSHKLEWYSGKHVNVQKGFFELMKKASLKKEFDYYAFADQDDVWDPDKLLIAINALEKNIKNVPSLYYCGQRLVDHNLKFIADHCLNEKRTLLTRFVLSDFAGCTGVFNQRLLLEVVKYEPEYMLMHDTWILKVCLALGGNVFVDPEPHMSYRQHGNNTLGLGKSFKSNLKQFKQYLCEYHVEPQMKELLKGYQNDMQTDYLNLAKDICNYRKDWKCKMKLLDTRNINFFNRGLNLTYKIKVISNKL